MISEYLLSLSIVTTVTIQIRSSTHESPSHTSFVSPRDKQELTIPIIDPHVLVGYQTRDKARNKVLTIALPELPGQMFIYFILRCRLIILTLTLQTVRQIVLIREIECTGIEQLSQHTYLGLILFRSVGAQWNELYLINLEYLRIEKSTNYVSPRNHNQIRIN